MLNFGSTAKLSPGESLYDAKTTKITKIKASTLADSLKNSTFYCYAKWQFAHGFAEYNIDAMLVMTTPGGDYYATYNSWDITDCRVKTICSWFFDVTDLLQRCADDNDGKFETGTYSFSMPGAISLGVGEPDFVTPYHIRNAAIDSILDGETQYTSNWGRISLRREIAQYLKNRYHLDYSPDNEVLVTIGASEGIDLAMGE